jgi:quinol monooxygenase YgiN
MSRVTEAVYLEIKAVAGREDELANLLIGGAALVTQHEPKTIHWFALRLDNSTFAVFDTFPDEAGKAEHFAGPVAAALKDNADALVEGGWDNGVIAKVQSPKIMAYKG